MKNSMNILFVREVDWLNKVVFEIPTCGGKKKTVAAPTSDTTR
jgi:hypothetical protein